MWYIVFFIGIRDSLDNGTLSLVSGYCVSNWDMGIHVGDGIQVRWNGSSPSDGVHDY